MKAHDVFARADSLNCLPLHQGQRGQTELVEAGEANFIIPERIPQMDARVRELEATATSGWGLIIRVGALEVLFLVAHFLGMTSYEKSGSDEVRSTSNKRNCCISRTVKERCHD